jgi:CRP-like cAMP-binding protein
LVDFFDRVLLLKRAPFFAEVETDDLRHVARALEEQVFESGEPVFRIDERGDHMYIVVSGRVGISTARDVRAKDFIAELGEGECFGEMNLVDELPRSATALALEATHLLTLEKARLRSLLMSYPAIAVGMLRALSLRLREAHRRARGQGR